MAKFSKENQPKKNGRHKLDIDGRSVYELGKIHCTIPEVAAVLGCSVATITSRFIDDLHRGHEAGQMSIKRKMHEKAFKGDGDTSMLIWLSKQRCDYKERRQEEEQNITFNINIKEVP